MSKTTFTLKNINIPKINQKYNLESENPSNFEDKNIAKTTKIADLNHDKHETVSFLDESKRIHKCKVIYIDYINHKDISNNKYSCFWCRHPFDNKPIGCPIKYISKQASKTYYSHISRTTYTIKDNVSRNNDIEENENLHINDGDYYESDGVFCSFECCMAFINDNKNKSLYKLSKQLLIKIYNDINNTKCQTINSAPHWRLLENYGGMLSISKFREGISKLDYEFQGEIRFVPTVSLYEEKIKF